MNDDALSIIPTGGVSVRGLRERFAGLSVRRAYKLMRQLPHVELAGEMYTTDPWIAQYLVARAIPQTNWPPRLPPRDPLDQRVLEMVIHKIRDLVACGELQIAHPTERGLSKKESAALARGAKETINARKLDEQSRKSTRDETAVPCQV